MIFIYSNKVITCIYVHMLTFGVQKITLYLQYSWQEANLITSGYSINKQVIFTLYVNIFLAVLLSMVPELNKFLQYFLFISTTCRK
jgi:hypothetical protein